MSSTPSEQAPQAELPEELLDEQEAPEVHPAGRFGYLNSMVGMRVMALAGIAFAVTIGLGTDGWGGSTCC